MTVSGSACGEARFAGGGVLAAMVLAGLLTACSGDSADPAAAEPRSVTSDRDGADLSDEVAALERAMGAASSEIIDDTTVRFVMAGGTADEPVSTECISADAFLPEGTTITIEYPDGERTC